MNYAVQTAASFNFSKRTSFTSSLPSSRTISTHPTRVERITINVGGERFQTYKETLARYPGSLLGSPARRRKFYDLARDELVFPDRNKEIFNAILFFYQAEILSRPQHVPLKIFAEEIKFFELTSYSSEFDVGKDKTEVFCDENAANSFRARLWNFLENPKSKPGCVFAKFNQLLLFVWIIMLCVETEIEPEVSWKKREKSCWFIIDTFFVLWFTADYLLHIVTAPHLTRYVCSAEGLVDLVTVLPYYLELLAKHATGIFPPQLQVLRFMRIFRIFKASRRSGSFRILVGTLASSAHDFPIWLLLILMHIFCFSSFLYFIEQEVGNPQLSNIPDAMWFTVITMCAVGYGDVVPETALGKFVTSIAAVCGIIIVYCIPAPTLKSNFTRLNELYNSKKEAKKHLEENIL